MIIEIDPKQVEYEKRVQGYCLLPYPKHPRGCPNYGHKKDLKGIRKDLRERVIRECPPTKLLNNVFDLSRNLFVVYNVFETGVDAEDRRLNNPKLKTPGEWYNIRYWQGKARARLYEEAENFLDSNPDCIVDLSPEAHGVNLDKLMTKIGLNLRWGSWPPEHSLYNIAFQIAFGGFPEKKKLF